MIIRPLLASDLLTVVSIRNHPSTIKQLHTQKKFNLSEAKVWFEKEKPLWFIIEEANKTIGYFRTSEWNFLDKSLYIGCDIDPTVRGKGFAKAAYIIFLQRLKEIGWNTAKLLVLKTNTVAFHLYEILGFKTISETEDSYYMEYKINDNLTTGKSCKVIACYFGDRRAPPKNAKDNLNMLKFNWEKETTLSQGFAYDTIFVNSRLTPKDKRTSDEDIAKCEAFLRDIDGKPTKNGKAIVIERENMGLSFGAFDYVFDKFKNDYDFWYFTEDDQILIKKNIYINSLKQLFMPTDPINGFVAVVGVNRFIDLILHKGVVKAATRQPGSKSKQNLGPAAYGGCGITSREILLKVRENNYSDILKRGHLPYHHTDDNNAAIHIIAGELRFTKAIHNLGYYLAEYDDEDIAICWGLEFQRTKLVVPFSVQYNR